ncbi:cadherin-17-like [Oncorhynchus kisutch]|uniref:Cadherin 17, LI cadherin (liver-intestine) n=1 Tax=Oncorhynchus kisutch TaxID=8019 RepID=A0A8C7MKM4_ONCKI|nr:cadherin-17-like [Oncorhynchus kisutch]XP_031643395.1 cadherin-17-like [Oncorhynchus kisutch]
MVHPTMHLLLLSLLIATAAGKGLEKGPLENKVLDVPEGTPVPYALYQFQASHLEVDGFRLTGETEGKISISEDGWLYLEQTLDWAHTQTHTLELEALVGSEPVEGPVIITINVLDVNNHAPSFNQTDYIGIVKERTPAGVAFARVFATDLDDPESPNAHLSYTLVSQIPNRDNTLFFQINSNTGEISATAEGERLLKARESVIHSRGGDFSDSLKKRFDDYCTPTGDIPYELNPFYSCVQRAESRRLNPLEDPDFMLIVRVEDMGGESVNALNGNARVKIVVQENLWVNPGPINLREQLKGIYPMPIGKVQSNDPSAFYRLVQKERELTFPFNVTEEGAILLTEELDREDKAMYILVVFAEDSYGNQVDPPLEVQVVVDDVNDNAPICEEELSVFEVQENEPTGSPVGHLMVHDADDDNTPNALLSYSLVTQTPSSVFTIDGISGRIQAKQMLQRRDATEYHLTVRVNDPGFSTECKVLIKVIDINNELPIFEMNDYGSHNLSEDTALGHTLLTVKATDADDPGTGSSRIEFHITAGNEDGVFAMETDDNGEGRLVVAKPLNYETASSYKLQIDARNPEPLVSGFEYGAESSAVVSVAISDVDEAPVFDMDILDVTVPEDTKEGATLLKIDAKDPEGKEILFKMEGDTKGWLEIDPATGEIKIKNKAVLDRETVEAFHFTVVAFEKANPELSSEREVSVRLLDVNDNVPKLTENQAFICVKKPQPIVLTALDADADPFGAPFTFSLAQGKKSPNWDLSAVDGTSAKLTLKKSPSEDKTFLIPINIKDNAGMGISQKFEVRVCNCTELGYCFTEPGVHAGVLGMPTTIGILAGTVGFIALVLIIAFHRIKKDNQKKALLGETDAIL